MPANFTDALEMFSRAKEYIRDSGLGSEVEWQRNNSIELFSETDFLRESAWVILCSGFRESVVRRVFNHFSLAYCDWESAAEILDCYPACKQAAKAVFSHDAKNEAIIEIARRINAQGFPAFKQSVLENPIQTLTTLPYIGKITAWHLAKNLGLDVAKPDRHLVRVSERLGFKDSAAFCDSLGGMVGEKSKVIDLIVWRYLADNPPLRVHWI